MRLILLFDNVFVQTKKKDHMSREEEIAISEEVDKEFFEALNSMPDLLND